MRIIAEGGSCHNDVKHAKDMASEARVMGAWAFKVQMYRADTLVTRDAPRYDHTTGAADTQHELFEKALDYDQWAEVKSWCDGIGIEFFASAFDFEAVDACRDMGVNYMKVASGDLTYTALLRYIAKLDIPVFLSTGAAYGTEIDNAIEELSMPNRPEIILMACTLCYPAQPHDAQLYRIRYLQQTYNPGGIRVGYSDHTRGTTVPMVAAALGATHLEKHFTITPMMGYDDDFAANPDELGRIVEGIAQTRTVLGTGELGPVLAEELARVGARRGFYASKDIDSGDVLIPGGNVAALRPCPSDIYSADEGELVHGLIAPRFIVKGEPIRRSLFGAP